MNLSVKWIHILIITLNLQGVKQCLKSDKRTEGVKCCLQPDNECLPCIIAKPSHHSVQNDCIEEQRDTRQNSRQG